MIKALPSTYCGVLFRSRLEARWAALFDHYAIDWVYEPEGYETPTGNYLPDFLLPGMSTFVEVKPAPGLADVNQLYELAKATGKNVLILDSPILQCRAYSVTTLYSDGIFEWVDMCWCCSVPYLGLNPRDGRQLFYKCTGELYKIGESVECHCNGRGDLKTFTKYRNLRFENGVAV
jgi:hypothetical protein